ncbi:MAG: DUF6316 family protein [Gammaproteobacteria bacterium]
MRLYLNRNGEASQPPHQRSVGRIYNIDDEWYFTVRRGYDQGPYASETAAREALSAYVQEQLEFERRVVSH